MNDYRSTLNAVGWVLATLSTLFIAARAYTRMRVKSMLGQDDWCMSVGWIFAMVCTSLVTVGTTYGFGQHKWDIKDPEDQAVAAMYVLLTPSFSIASAFFTKTSIIIGFMRIMGRTITWVQKLIAYLQLVFLFVGSVLSCGIMIFFCWPVQKSWRPYLAGSCADPAMLNIIGKSVSAYNAIMDLFCAFVPYFLIRNLNITRKDKRNLIILMGGSIFGTVATIMKIIAMSSISNVADITHSWSEITIWYLFVYHSYFCHRCLQTENHVLIIAGSFPALHPLWRMVIGKYSVYRSSKKSEGTSQNSSQKSPSGNISLHTVGSTPKDRKMPGLYSIAVRGSSEESLSPQQKEGDIETVEAVLSHHGDYRIDYKTQIAGGENGSRSAVGDTGITITKEVEVV